jgi:hypothetical protein
MNVGFVMIILRMIISIIWVAVVFNRLLKSGISIMTVTAWVPVKDRSFV